MNSIQDFLLLNPDAILEISSPILQTILMVAFMVHTLAWGLVILLLPFKLLSWITTVRK